MAYDVGVSGERTALAWDRTALSIMAGSAVVSRLTYDRLGLVSLLAIAIAVPLGALVMIEGHGRYARDGGGQRTRTRPRGGRAPAAIAVATCVVALVELVALLR